MLIHALYIYTYSQTQTLYLYTLKCSTPTYPPISTHINTHRSSYIRIPSRLNIYILTHVIFTHHHEHTSTSPTHIFTYNIHMYVHCVYTNIICIYKHSQAHISYLHPHNILPLHTYHYEHTCISSQIRIRHIYTSSSSSLSSHHKTYIYTITNTLPIANTYIHHHHHPHHQTRSQTHTSSHTHHHTYCIRPHTILSLHTYNCAHTFISSHTHIRHTHTQTSSHHQTHIYAITNTHDTVS